MNKGLFGHVTTYDFIERLNRYLPETYKAILDLADIKAAEGKVFLT
jgi:hypothetical protein